MAQSRMDYSAQGRPLTIAGERPSTLEYEKALGTGAAGATGPTSRSPKSAEATPAPKTGKPRASGPATAPAG
jgi:hypothetical protein